MGMGRGGGGRGRVEGREFPRFSVHQAHVRIAFLLLKHVLHLDVQNQASSNPVVRDFSGRPGHAIQPTSIREGKRDLLVNGRLGNRSVLSQTLREPKGNLLESVLNGVGTVADVSTHVDREVASDRSGDGGEGVGSLSQSNKRPCGC